MAQQLDQTASLSKPPLYVSTKNETVRMFDSDFMEFFSHVHPATPLILYLPVVGFMLYVALWRQGFPIFVVVGFFLLGMLLWTLTEYLIHRYIFHYEPKTRVGKRLHYIIHGVHHDYPNDAKRLVMPPSVSVPLAFLFYGIFLLIFGRFVSGAFAAGATVAGGERIAYVAHLGGIAFAWLYMRTPPAASIERFRQRISPAPDYPQDETPRAIPRTLPRTRNSAQRDDVDEIVAKSKAVAAQQPRPVTRALATPVPPPHEERVAELDRVLDKISLEGAAVAKDPKNAWVGAMPTTSLVLANGQKLPTR